MVLQTRLRDHYDWVVLGDHPGALLSAGLAARLGLSVLVLPLGDRFRSQVSREGQHFDPETNYLLGMGNGLLADCLARLGLLPAEQSLIQPQGCVIQVAQPGVRLSLPGGAERLKFELDREFGQGVRESFALGEAVDRGGKQIFSYWSETPRRLTIQAEEPEPKKKGAPVKPKTFGDFRRQLRTTVEPGGGFSWLASEDPVSQVVERCRTSELLECAAGFWYGATGSLDADPRAADFFNVLVLAESGVSFRGGMSAYREFLLRMARRLGAHIPQKTECRSLCVENGRFLGIQAAQHGNMIGASGGVLGCSLAQAGPYLSEGSRVRLSAGRRAAKAVGWKFTVALTVNAEAIPTGMLPRLVWQERGAPPLEIEVSDPADYDARNRGNRVIFLRTVLPMETGTLRPEHLRMIAARMLRQLTELAPYLEFHVMRIYPDFRTAPGGELGEVYAFSSLEAIPDNLLCYSGEGIGSRTGIDGLFAASGESYPALGSFGGTIAALESIAWLAHRNGLAGPFV